jgi:hypothetical protein
MTFKTTLAAAAAPRAMFRTSTSPSPMIRGPMVAYAPDDGTGALSVADAVAALREPEPAAEPEAAAEDAPEGDPAAEPEAEELPPESEPEPTGEEPLDPETAIEGEERTEEPESDPATPAIAAPKSWDASERAVFATLPPATQAIIANRETERDRAVSRVQQEATTARKAAEADLAGLAQFKTKFDQIATRAEKVFADQWANVDWVALAESDPATYTIAKARYDAHLGELRIVQQAQADADKVKQTAEQTEFQNYVREEFANLSEVAPEMADAKTGPAIRTAVTEFLRGQTVNGQRAIPDEAITRISAVEMAIARDAMEFRKLKASGKLVAARPAATATRPAPAPARAAAPSAAPALRPAPQRNVDAAMNRLAQTGRTEDALAVMRARRGAN